MLSFHVCMLAMIFLGGMNFFPSGFIYAEKAVSDLTQDSVPRVRHAHVSCDEFSRKEEFFFGPVLLL